MQTIVQDDPFNGLGDFEIREEAARLAWFWLHAPWIYSIAVFQEAVILP